MTKVKDFNEVLVFADLVVEENGAVQKFAHARALSNATAHAREASQELHMVEKRVAETCSGFWVIFSDAADDACEIV